MTEQPSLAAALAAFQASLPMVPKATTGNRGKYADLADLSPIILPKLAEHGMSWSCLPRVNDQGQFVLAYKLRHVSGDVDEGEWPLPDPSSGSQAMGSAVTYGRRYCLCAVTGVAPDNEDDDGERSRETSHRASPPAQRRNPPNGQRRQPDPVAKAAEDLKAVTEPHVAAKEKLRASCKENDWDMTIVADLFAGEQGIELKETTNPAVIETFRQRLFSIPAEQLKAKAAAS